MAEKHRPTFKKYVNIACYILRTERRERGGTIAEVALKCYQRDTARGQKVFLRTLMRLSEALQFADDAVRLIGEDQLGKTRRAPRELEKWMAKTKVSQRPALTSRGPDPNTTILRNCGIIIAVACLADLPNMTATRNASRGEDCSFEGGSACDAVGIAVNRVYAKELKEKQPKKKQLKNKQNEDEQNEDKQNEDEQNEDKQNEDKQNEDKKITYKTIERIWLARDSYALFLALPDYFIFRFHNQYEYDPPMQAGLSDKKKEKPADDR